jgi:hypothetical protein
MKQSPIPWRFLALLAVAAVSAINLVQLAQRVPPPAVPVPGAAVDSATRQERRLAEIRRELSARSIRGVVGYITDFPAEIPASAAAGEDHYLAQYALLPVVLDLNAAAREWSVANLRNSRTLPPGWQVEQDCGDGVFLLRRARP